VVCNSRWSVLSSYCSFIYNNGTTLSGPCSVQEYEALTCNLWVWSFGKQSMELVRLCTGVVVAASEHSPGQFCVHNTEYYEKSAITRKKVTQSLINRRLLTQKNIELTSSAPYGTYTHHICARTNGMQPSTVPKLVSQRLQSNTWLTFKICGSHSTANDDQVLLECDAYPSGEHFLMFHKITMPSSSGWSN